MATNDEYRQSAEKATSGGQMRIPDPASVLDIDTVSALAIENGSFGVADIADRAVSYVMLREAGVSPLAADRLRRRYSLTWTFVWTEGAHLLQRAEQLRTLRENERAWIAASTTTADRQQHRVRRRWREIRETEDETQPLETDDWSGGDTDPDFEACPQEATNRTCPRCGDPLMRYTLGRCETVTCERCGFARLNAVHAVESSPGGAARDDGELSWEESVRQFVAEE